MIVYFSTVVRAAPPERGGEIVKVNWETKEIMARVPIVAKDPPVKDPNPRGSTRGGRGILLNDQRVFVASYHSINEFDHDFNFIRQINNNLFANLHELCWEGNDIWVTATDIDAAVKVDLNGKTVESWWPREDKVSAEKYSLAPLEIDKERDNRTAFVGIGSSDPGHVHINAAAMNNGRPLMSLNKFGCIVKLNPTEVLLEDQSLKGCHNVLVTDDGFIIVNNTVHKAVHVYNHEGELYRKVNLLDFREVYKLYRRFALSDIGCWLAHHGRPSRVFYNLFRNTVIARPIFVRGLCQTKRESILVGISPAAILEINWKTGELMDIFYYSGNKHVCVHGLACK